MGERPVWPRGALPAPAPGFSLEKTNPRLFPKKRQEIVRTPDSADNVVEIDQLYFKSSAIAEWPEAAAISIAV